MAERHADANNRINCQISERRQRDDGPLLGGIGEGKNNKKERRKKTKRKKNPGDRLSRGDLKAGGGCSALGNHQGALGMP